MDADIVMRASIIIVNYNGRDDLLRCLQSISEQENPDNIEIIVVDNNSKDGSVDRVGVLYPQVTVLRRLDNHGFGYGNNLGARRARGQYLAFLNPDTVVSPGWLETLISVLEAEPDAGLATPKILLRSDTNRINACGHRVHLSGLVQCRGLGAPAADYDLPEEVEAVSGAAFVMKRDLFERLGGFDAPFFLYIEDTDLSWRAWLAGYRCLYVPDAYVYHDYRLHFGAKKLFYYERNRYLLLLKNLRWRTLLILLPVLLLAEVIAWGFVLWRDRGNWRNKLRAYVWIIRNWGEIVQGRQNAQSMRRIRDRDLLMRCKWGLAWRQVGDGPVPRLAQVVFDPVFYLLKGMAMALIWW